MNKGLRVAAPLAYMAGIYVLSSVPGDIRPEDAALLQILAFVPPKIQNVLHIPLYGLLAWLWCWSLGAWPARGSMVYVAALALTLGYGLFDEWHQSWVPGRYASTWDMIMNGVGAALGLWLYVRLNKLRAVPTP